MTSATQVADVAPLRSWSDAALADEQRALATERRRIDARSALIAAEIARRAAAGWSTASGERLAVDAVQRLTGGTLGEARALIAVGRLADAEAPTWMRPIGEAVADGRLGIAAANALRVGLGDVAPDVDATALGGAAERLVDDATRIPAERLAARARQERDLLDASGVAEREAERRSRRFLKLVPLDDGMTRISGLLDTESAARVRSAFDQVTAPRRSAPRFIEATERQRAAEIAADPRTTEQLLLDRFVEMVERAVAADEGAIFGARRPGVRVHVALRDLHEGSGGSAWIEGAEDAVSAETAQRILCQVGVVPVLFDERGSPLDVGRTQRLHTTRQRIAIASRDGGCRWPDCDRPPSWTEVHHPIPWSEGGETSVENGISLCAFHHLRVHNERWRVERDDRDYWLIPPGRGAAPPGASASSDRSRQRVRMPTRSHVRT